MGNEQCPVRQTAGLVTEKLDGEYVGYTPKGKIFHLNPIASQVFEECNGYRNVADIVADLSAKLGIEISEEWVELALGLLTKNRLIIGGTHHVGERYSRRRFAALGILALTPVVASFRAPTSAEALSPVPSCIGQPNGTLCTKKSGRPGTCKNGNCV